MKSKKITSIKQAREIIQHIGILEIEEDEDKDEDNLITWWDGYYVNAIGYLYRDNKSRKIYLPVSPDPSNLRVIGKVFKYEVVCSIYRIPVDDISDTSILWLKEAVYE